MKFLIDENLPIEIVKLFEGAQHQAFHVNDIKTDKTTRIHDDVLRRYALYRDYIIVTKDHDFVRSWRSRKVPDRMIFVHHQGPVRDLLILFEKHLLELMETILNSDFIELGSKGIRLPFDTEDRQE